MVLNHAEKDIAIFAVAATPILTCHGKGVIERQTSCVEAYAMAGKVPGGLCIIPLEIVIFHATTGYPYPARMSRSGSLQSHASRAIFEVLPRTVSTDHDDDLGGAARRAPLVIATGPDRGVRRPLGITIVGGLLVSQVLTL